MSRTFARWVILGVLLIVASASTWAQSEDSPLLWGPNLGAPADTSMAVSWRTDRPVAIDLQYGIARVVDATGEWDETLSFDRQEGLAEIWLRDLIPGTTYRYQVIAYEGDAVFPSEVGTFRTLGADLRSATFVVYGSTRSLPDRHRMVADAIRSAEADATAIFHVGDLVEIPTIDQYANHFWAVGDLGRDRPYLSVIGDHEAGSETYHEIMVLPQGGGASGEEWWSLDVGPIHWVGLDSTVARDPAALARQTEWLRADLAANDRPLTIVLSHHALYGCGYAGGRNETLVGAWEDLFVEGGVRLVLSGDATCYEHEYVRGIHHVTTGGGGAPLARQPLGVAPGTVFLRFGVLHYVRISLADEALRVEAIPVATVTENGIIYPASTMRPLDSFVLRSED